MKVNNNNTAYLAVAQWALAHDIPPSVMHCLSPECSLIVVVDCFDEDNGIAELVKLNEWLTDAQHWFNTHSCSSFRKDQAKNGEKTAIVWPAAT